MTSTNLLTMSRRVAVFFAVVGVWYGDVAAQPASKLDLAGKIVIANVDKFPSHFRVGKTKKKVEPRKASVLTPKRFPVDLEIWNGVRGRAAWVPQRIAAPGIYKFQFRRGSWTLTKASPRSPTSRRTVRPPRRLPYRRVTGAAPRVVRGYRRPYYVGRIPLLRRVAVDVLGLYRFVRDEEDRDLLRDLVIGREIDREVEREILDKLDDVAVSLPAHERRDLERAFEGLKNLSDKDLRDLEAATDEDWGQVRDSLGGQVTDTAWRDLEADFGNLDIQDLSDQDIAGLEEVGIDSLESDIDLNDLDTGDVDIGDTLDDIDVGELGGAMQDIGIDDLGTDLGGDWGGDDGGLGGGLDYDGGGFDDFGGGLDDGGGFDDGGFDDFGGGFDDF